VTATVEITGRYHLTGGRDPIRVRLTVDGDRAHLEILEAPAGAGGDGQPYPLRRTGVSWSPDSSDPRWGLLWVDAAWYDLVQDRHGAWHFYHYRSGW
jgi:hypothetical protein